MATTTKPRPGYARAAAPALPRVTVARFEQATLLIEALLVEKTSVFAEHATRYRREMRSRSERDLTATEAASIAAGLADALGTTDPAEAMLRVQQTGLRAHDDPPPGEVLMAAGLATAPAFLNAAMRLVALIELPDDALELAVENDALPAALDAALVDLRRLDMTEAKDRADRALRHFADKSGVDPGEVVGLVAKMLGHALNTAMGPMTTATESASSLSINSPTPTDGTDA